MNSWAQAIVVLSGTAIFNALAIAFIYGKLTQKVTDLVGWNKHQDGRLDNHDETLLRHQGEIAYIKGQKGIPHGD